MNITDRLFDKLWITWGETSNSSFPPPYNSSLRRKFYALERACLRLKKRMNAVG